MPRAEPRARLAVSAILVVALSSCGGASSPEPGADDAVPAMSHVHGLGTNPSDGEAYLATHAGIFRLPEGAEPVHVAGRFQDTMGFTIVGPDRFLGSGHPDLTDEDLPTHLGLIESDDAGETWTIRSLGGEADLHALDAGPRRIFAADAVAGRLISSEDGKRWEDVDRGHFVDLAADPTRPDHVLATTTQGELVSYEDGRAARSLDRAPAVGFVDWPAADLLAGIDAQGVVHVSRDRGATWSPASEPLGRPQALDVSADAWLVATEGAVLRSSDEGRTWETLVSFTT